MTKDMPLMGKSPETPTAPKKHSLAHTICVWLVIVQIVGAIVLATVVVAEAIYDAPHRVTMLNFCTFYSTVVITLISIVILWSELMQGFWTVMALLVMPSIQFALGCIGAYLILLEMNVHGLALIGQIGLILAPFLGFLNNAIPTTHQAMKDKELADLERVHRENIRRESQIQAMAQQVQSSTEQTDGAELSPRPKAKTFEEPFRWREILKTIALALAAIAYILGFLWV